MHRFYRAENGYTDAEFRNNGVLTDPDQDATFYVELYDAEDTLQGTYSLSTDPAIEAIATGEFKLQDYALSAYALGVGYARWYAKVAGEEVEPYPYVDYWGHILADPTGYNLCSLDDLKTFLEITDDTQDEHLANLILRATAFVETYCRRQFAEREHTDWFTGDGTREVRLSQYPVVSLSVVQDVYVAQAFNYGASDEHEDWECDLGAGILTLLGDKFHAWPPKGYKVVFVAGYDPIPEDLRQVCVELAAAKFYLKDSQRSGVASKTVGGQTTTFRPDDLSPAQKEVLEFYSGVTVGAV